MEQKSKQVRFKEIAVEPPKKTYFFQFPGKKPFAVEEVEAGELYRGKGTWTKQGVQYIGQSDGIKAYEARIEASKIRAPQHECTFYTMGDCVTCETATQDAQDIIRAGVEAEVEEAKKNTTPPSRSDIYFMGNMSKDQKDKIRNQISE
jgi:hypothetical protein